MIVHLLTTKKFKACNFFLLKALPDCNEKRYKRVRNYYCYSCVNGRNQYIPTTTNTSRQDNSFYFDSVRPCECISKPQNDGLKTTQCVLFGKQALG
jgi:hypothetical protein